MGQVAEAPAPAQGSDSQDKTKSVGLGRRSRACRATRARTCRPIRERESSVWASPSHLGRKDTTKIAGGEHHLGDVWAWSARRCLKALQTLLPYTPPLLPSPWHQGTATVTTALSQ